MIHIFFNLSENSLASSSGKLRGLCKFRFLYQGLALPAVALPVTLLLLAFAASIQALPPEYILIPPSHPVLQHNAVSAIAVERDKIAWGLTTGLLIESAQEETRFWHPGNSPLTEGEFAGIALHGHEIWCATRTYSRGNGVCHFDGKTWRHLVSGSHGILSNEISALHLDRDKFVWVGFDRLGVCKYIGDVNPFRYFEEVTVKDGLLAGKIMSILMQETHLWTGMINGLSRVRTEISSQGGRNIDSWTTDNGFPGNNVVALECFGTDGVVAGTDTGLAFWDGTGWQSFGRREGLRVGRVRALAVVGKTIWVGGFRGLQQWTSTGVGPLLTEDDGLPANKITALAVINPGTPTEKLLIGTEMGAAILGRPTVPNQQQPTE